MAFKVAIFLAIFFVVLRSKYSSQECQQADSVYLPQDYLIPENPDEREWFFPLKQKPSQDQVISILSGQEVDMEGGGDTTVCLSAKVESKALTGTFHVECSFQNMSALLCTIAGGEDVPVLMKPLLPKYVSFVPVMTDEKTYAAFLACVGGHTNYWMTTSTKPTLGEGVEPKIIEYFQNLGMETNDEDGMDFDTTEIEVIKGGCDPEA